MKRIALLLNLFILFAYSAFAQQYYYLYQHQKIFLKPDSSVIYAEFENRDSMNLFLQKVAGIESLKGDIQRKSSKSLIFTFKSKGERVLLHRLSSIFSFSSPLLKHNQARIMLVPQIIVELKEGYKINAFLLQYKNNLSLKDMIGSNEYLLNVNTSTFERVFTLANRISENNDMVEWCEPNFYNSFQVASDPLYSEQFYLNNTGQNGGTPGIDINVSGAWNITKGSSTIKVAVIGTGVENHEDFNGRVLNGYTAGNPSGNGLPQNENTYSVKAHGEAVAGIIAATQDNNIGIKGIDPTVQIVPVNIFPNFATQSSAGAATNAQIAQAINWAYDPNGGDADVLSNSWGGGAPSDAINTAIDNAETYGRGGNGSIVVFLSGNTIPHQDLWYPAYLDGVIAVGAIQNNGDIWYYSDRGPSLDLVAPSGDIELTGDVVTTDRMGSLGYETGNYTTRFGGTSAACPQVAGVVCLMLSVRPDLDEYWVRRILQETATDMGASGFDNTFGYGRVNACRAVGEVFASSSIQGPTVFCNNSATYSISSAIDPNIVTWSATPSGVVNLSPNGDQVTVTKISNGEIELTATITACGTNYSTIKNVQVGIPDPVSGIDVFPGDPMNLCPYTQYSAGVVPPVYRGYQYIWWVPQEWSQWNDYPTITYDIQFDFQTGGYTNPNGVLLTVQKSNECGVSTPYSIPIQVTSNCQNASSFSISPNPASETINITTTTTSIDRQYSKIKKTGNIGLIKTVNIYTSAGKLVKQQLFSKNSLQVQMDVSLLPPGIYFVEISDGRYTETQKLVIGEHTIFRK